MTKTILYLFALLLVFAIAKPTKGDLDCFGKIQYFLIFPFNNIFFLLVCKSIISDAEKYISSNSSETDVENFLDHTACAILIISDLKRDCENLVQEYYPAFVSYIISRETPTVACEQLQVCPTNSTQAKQSPPLLKLNAVKPTSQKVKGALECTLCTTIVNLAESILGSNASETTIENFLEHTICGILPSTLAQDCDSLVEAYLPALVQYIQQGESGSVACAQLGLCNSTSTAPLLKLNIVKPNTQKVKNSLECAACEVIVQLAETFLGSNASESSIENFLENTVCGLVPSSYTSVCDTLVKQYTPSLVTYIQNSVSPSVACAGVGLCTSNKKQAQKTSTK